MANPAAHVSDPSILTFRFREDGPFSAFFGKLNAMIDAINCNRITTGRGMFHHRKHSGVTLYSISSASTDTDPNPFNPISALDPDPEGGIQISIQPGYIQAQSTVWPDNDDGTFTIPPNSSHYKFWLQINVSGVAPGDTLDVDTTVYDQGTDVPENPSGDWVTGTLPTVLYLPLFEVDTDATSITNQTVYINNCQQLFAVVSNVDCSTGNQSRSLGLSAV